MRLTNWRSMGCDRQPSGDSIMTTTQDTTTGTMLFKVQATKDAVVGDGMVAIPISRTDGKKGKSGLCIVVPQVSDAAADVIFNDERCQDWLITAINGFKSAIASAINKKNEAITSAKLGTDAILNAMRAETESQRMTKDAIGAWFDADLAQLIAARIESKMQGIAADKVAKLVEGYKARFMALAGRDVSTPDAVKEQLTVALSLLPDGYENTICEKVAEKLAEVSEATETLAAL